jgi:hypothetical protein
MSYEGELGEVSATGVSHADMQTFRMLSARHDMVMVE